MPSIAGHMVVAKLVSEKLKIDDLDFIKGNVLPDILNNPLSHYKKIGKYFLVPDIQFFKQKLDLNNKLELGYFTHLLLDKYFLEEYIPNNISDLKIFDNKIIYEEYNLINYLLVKKFDLDVLYLKNLLNEIDYDISKEKLEKNIKWLCNTKFGDTKYLDFESFSSFLYNISFRIYKEIEEYAN